MSLKKIFNTSDEKKQWVKLADIYPKFAVGNNKNAFAVNPIMPEIIIKNLNGADAQETIDAVVESLLIASQSDIGYQVLSMVNDLGYKIIIDLKNNDNNAQLDFINKSIDIYDIGKSINSFALILIHESVHAIQCDAGDITPSFLYNPVDCIKIIMAMEADVRAFELLASLQIANTEDDFKGQQFIVPEIIGDFKERVKTSPDMLRLLDRLSGNHKEYDIEKILMAGFLAMYDSPRIRSLYERTTLQSLIANGLESFRNPELYAKRISSAELIDKFAMANIKYIKKYINSPDLLDTAFYRAVSDETVKNLDVLQAERQKNPANKDEEDWDFISYSDIKKEQDRVNSNPKKKSSFAKL